MSSVNSIVFEGWAVESKKKKKKERMKRKKKLSQTTPEQKMPRVQR